MEWTLEDTTGYRRPFLTPDCPVWHAREYLVHQPARCCETNTLITHLKFKPEWTGLAAIKHSAMVRFAEEACSFLEVLDEDFLVTWIPSSRSILSNNHDDRLALVASLIQGLLPHATALRTLMPFADRLPMHSRKIRRTPKELAACWLPCKLENPIEGNSIVFILDDVVTTGASMHAAMKMMRRMASPETRIFGLAWAFAREKEDA